MKKSLFLTALCLFSQGVAAHSLYLFAQYDGRQISGKSYYSDMTPARETYIEAYRRGEKEPAVFGKTDEKGEFRLPVQGDAVFEVVIEGAEGHRATTVAEKIEAADSNRGNELLLLREDINHLKDKIYLRDILGGIGYIVGIAGLLFGLKAGRKKQEKS
ncbi:nickel transport protein [Mesocricetibacter intestinalis]|uniref:Nickel transport protein n=1 Tax=Mesocricetibacter intestinalis TaxID=1521930 RepID=A0A4R6VHR6_9PAST|nr:carboxypeptidase regulatory-like domain-containing protein [Mesocricetibacter intestinalis]TDQ57904.1 nickel transport protein [Mesocricetibacter intestinalis]